MELIASAGKKPEGDILECGLLASLPGSKLLQQMDEVAWQFGFALIRLLQFKCKMEIDTLFTSMSGTSLSYMPTMNFWSSSFVAPFGRPSSFQHMLRMRLFRKPRRRSSGTFFPRCSSRMTGGLWCWALMPMHALEATLGQVWAILVGTFQTTMVNVSYGFSSTIGCVYRQLLKSMQFAREKIKALGSRKGDGRELTSLLTQSAGSTMRSLLLGRFPLRRMFSRMTIRRHVCDVELSFQLPVKPSQHHRMSDFALIRRKSTQLKANKFAATSWIKCYINSRDLLHQLMFMLPSFKTLQKINSCNVFLPNLVFPSHRGFRLKLGTQWGRHELFEESCNSCESLGTRRCSLRSSMLGRFLRGGGHHAENG